MAADLGTDERRVAIEVISTLVHIKRTLIELILKPAGVPPMLTERLFDRRDPMTNKPLTKRQVAPLLLDELNKSNDLRSSIRAIVRIGSANFAGFDKSLYTTDKTSFSVPNLQSTHACSRNQATGLLIGIRCSTD